jgi:hypothetical protein
MTFPHRLPMRPHPRAWRRLAAATGLAAVLATPAAADEATARQLVKAMSDYVAAQTAIAFDYTSTLDVVTTDGLTISLASSGSVALARPDRFRMTRTGGFADVEMVFDGKTATLLGKNLNAYAEIEAPGSIDQLIDTLRETYNLSPPGADLLAANPGSALAGSITAALDLGSGVINGLECDHVALRAEDVDVQVWIAQGDGAASLPHRDHQQGGGRGTPLQRRHQRLAGRRCRPRHRLLLHRPGGRDGGRHRQARRHRRAAQPLHPGDAK